MRKHGHGHGGGGAGGVNLGLIITPMLDMAFQILSFFIMTYHPSALEGHIPGSLVPPENIAKNNKNNPNPAPTDSLSVPEDELLPELAEAVQVRIRAVQKGQVEGSRREGMPKEIALKVGSTSVSFEPIAGSEGDFEKNDLRALEGRLKEIAKGGDKANIKIEGDADLKQMYVMMVYDTCKKAGFGKIHFVPPPMNRSGK